jgi:hypothetical protein
MASVAGLGHLGFMIKKIEQPLKKISSRITQVQLNTNRLKNGFLPSAFPRKEPVFPLSLHIREARCGGPLRISQRSPPVQSSRLQCLIGRHLKSLPVLFLHLTTQETESPRHCSLPKVTVLKRTEAMLAVVLTSRLFFALADT